MNPDTGNISKDAATGLKSRAYFLVGLERTIGELTQPDARSYGILAVHLQNPTEAQLKEVASWMEKEADYATHYLAGQSDVVAGVFRVPGMFGEQTVVQREHWRKTHPEMRFGIGHLALEPDNSPEQALDRVARDAYDDMITHPPAL